MRHIPSSADTLKLNGKIDKLALVVGIIEPLTTFPQIYLVFTSHDVSQVSLFMWTGYNVSSVILLIYGLKHKLLPVIGAQILWLFVQTLMMIAVFIFR